jgi:hypothetical protein
MFISESALPGDVLEHATRGSAQLVWGALEYKVHRQL